MSKAPSVLHGPAEKLCAEAFNRRHRAGAEADRRRFLARMLAAAGSSVACTVDSSAETPLTLPVGSPSGPEDESYWSKVRAQFAFEPNLIYLNNASLGVPPRIVIQAVADGYQRLAANPAAAKLELADYLANTLRPAVARLLGAGPDEIAITRGASESLYLIANGFDLSPGDEVLTTSQEHPAGLTPWQIRAERTGVVVRQAPIPSPFLDEHEVVSRIENAITSRTKVLLFCHATRGGLRYPVKELCELARRRGVISAVDGAQAVGVLPVDVHALGCDLYANSLHKWSLAPATEFSMCDGKFKGPSARYSTAQGLMRVDMSPSEHPLYPCAWLRGLR